MARGGRGLVEVGMDVNDIVTLGGTLLTNGSNANADNAFAMSSVDNREEAKTPGLELKDQGSSSRGDGGQGSGER